MPSRPQRKEQQRGRTLSVCSVPGCPALAYGGRCETHKRKAEQDRGSAAERGYGGRAWRVARRAVLRRDPVCVVCNSAPSTLPDHHPYSRKELLAMGVSDPDAPHRMRGVCASCHGKETAREQPGGWNRR